jgi:hypothetical protein
VDRGYILIFILQLMAAPGGPQGQGVISARVHVSQGPTGDENKAKVRQIAPRRAPCDVFTRLGTLADSACLFLLQLCKTSSAAPVIREKK